MKPICSGGRKPFWDLQLGVMGIHVGIYVIAEIYLVYITIDHWRRYVSTRTNKYFILLFVFAHLSWLVTIVYMTYEIFEIHGPLYDFLNETPILWYNLGVLTLLCKMQETLYRVRQEWRFYLLERGLWIGGLIHTIAHLVLMFLEEKGVLPQNTQKHYLLPVECIFFFGFGFLGLYLYTIYESMFDNFAKVRKKWRFCSISLFILLAFRVFFSVINSAGLRQNWDECKPLIRPFYFISLSFACDITPFLVLIMFMQLQSEETLDVMLLSSAPSESLAGFGAGVVSAQPSLSGALNPK